MEGERNNNYEYYADKFLTKSQKKKRNKARSKFLSRYLLLEQRLQKNKDDSFKYDSSSPNKSQTSVIKKKRNSYENLTDISNYNPNLLHSPIKRINPKKMYKNYSGQQSISGGSLCDQQENNQIFDDNFKNAKHYDKKNFKSYSKLKPIFSERNEKLLTGKRQKDCFCSDHNNVSQYKPKTITDNYLSYYLGEVTRKQAEQMCPLPSLFRLYHRISSTLSNIMPSLPLTIVYHTSQSQYYHYRILCKKLPDRTKHFMINISGEIIFPSLRSLIDYYSTYVFYRKTTNENTKIDCFPWWKSSKPAVKPKEEYDLTSPTPSSLAVKSELNFKRLNKNNRAYYHLLKHQRKKYTKDSEQFKAKSFISNGSIRSMTHNIPSNESILSNQSPDKYNIQESRWKKNSKATNSNLTNSSPVSSNSLINDVLQKKKDSSLKTSASTQNKNIDYPIKPEHDSSSINDKASKLSITDGLYRRRFIRSYQLTTP